MITEKITAESNSGNPLQQRLDDLANKATSQSAELLSLQREIKALTPVIGGMDTNLSKFDSDWPGLKASLQRIRQNTELQLLELQKELSSESIRNLDRAIEQHLTEDNTRQEECNKLNQALHGPSSWNRISAEVEEILAKSVFTELHVSSMDKRISTAEARLKKASAVVTNCDEHRAEKYVLLRMIAELLDKTRVETACLTHLFDFQWPKSREDYQKALLCAAQKYVASQEAVFQMKATEEEAKADFKQKNAAVLANRQNREERLIARAKSSVAGNSGKCVIEQH